VIAVETQGLTPGVYRIKYGEGSNDVRELGLITIRDPDAIPDVEAGGNRHEDSTTHHSEGIRSRIVIVLPVDVAPNKIRYIRLADLGGTVFLEGRAR
jgi:hypothetical protein